MASTELYNYFVISPLYGFKLREGLNELTWGDYILCNRTYIHEKYSDAISTFKCKYQIDKQHIAEIDFYFVINKNIMARTIEDAKKIFTKNIDQLINTLLYCIPCRREENAKISTRTEEISQFVYIKSESTAHESFSNYDLASPLYILDDKVLTYPGNDIRLFKYIGTEPTSNIQRRIKRAVNWIGQSLRNPDITEGFLWLAIALETLLIAQDGFISKSITAQLAEYVAFLTADTFDERKIINGKIKEIYRKRSAVVHSFSVDIKEDDFEYLLGTLKGIIYSYFKLIDEKKISKMEEVVSYIEELRFS